jgi:hypothetical protein
MNRIMKALEGTYKLAMSRAEEVAVRRHPLSVFLNLERSRSLYTLYSFGKFWSEMGINLGKYRVASSQNPSGGGMRARARQQSEFVMAQECVVRLYWIGGCMSSVYTGICR